LERHSGIKCYSCDTEKEYETKTQTAEDAKLRTSLEDMIATEDIKFLESCIAGGHLEQSKLSTKEFRNVSIITALNAQKDRINELGSAQLLQRQVRL